MFSVLALALIGYRIYSLTAPFPVQAIYQQGLQSISAGDIRSALLTAEALSVDGINPNYKLVLEGAIDLRLGQLQQAAIKLESPREFPPTSTLALTLTGEILYKNRQFSAAIQVLRQAVAADDALIDAHRWLAACYYDIGATGPTVQELAMVSKLDRNDARPHRLTGLIYKDMESYEAAIEEFREALRRSSDSLDSDSPDSQSIRQQLAECLFEVRKYEELDALLEECPINPITRTLAAQSQQARGESDRALQLVDQAVGMDPEYLPALLLKAAIQAEKSQLDDAAGTLRAAAEYHPLDNRVHYQLSQVLARLGDTVEAEKHAAEATRLRDLRVHFTDLHAQASEDIGNADLRYQLGVVAKQLGLVELAESWLSAALALDPNLSQARLALSEMRQENQDSVTATTIQGPENRDSVPAAPEKE